MNIKNLSRQDLDIVLESHNSPIACILVEEIVTEIDHFATVDHL